MVEVLLTADRTLMSNHHSLEFLGFGATAPPNFVPEWFYRFLFFPPIKRKDGIPAEAPYGLRKIEAQLIKEGFDVLTVDPDHLHKYLDDAKVLGIHVMDPFGFGPSSTTFAGILKTGETYNAKYFRLLLEKPEIAEAKKRGLKIIIGGPGVWQFKLKWNFVEKHRIDCIVDGEAERVIGDIFRTALEGGELPKYIELSPRDSPKLDEIPEIVNPSVNGLVEIGRGCCRGCKFCSVTLRPLRWYPYEKVEKEVLVNVKAGIKGCILHAEDVMLYGSRNVIPNEEKVLKLHEIVKKHVKNLGWSHCSIAAVAAAPKTFEKLSEIILTNQDWFGAEVGIETGSPELAKKIMPAKAKPFKAEEWPEVVKHAAGIMNDNGLIPACTLIIGLPEETNEDIIKTIELIDDLKDFKSLIVPLLFVPMGKLNDKNFFMADYMKDLHMELMTKCLRRDLYWAKKIMNTYLSGWKKLLWPFFSIFIKAIERRAKKVKIEELIGKRRGEVEIKKRVIC